jgi:hypothetical protein
MGALTITQYAVYGSDSNPSSKKKGNTTQTKSDAEKKLGSFKTSHNVCRSKNDD